MTILAIESSCDETASAVIKDGTTILSNVIASSSAMHEKYGGIVPEVASREQLKCILPTIQEALEEAHLMYDSIDAIAVTIGPGLIGSLLIGVETAKTIAYVTKKPLIPVNHVLAHLYANFLSSSNENSSRAKSRDCPIAFPAIGLVVSGGHTELFLMNSVKELKWLGGTIDDAAGEAFDKTARLLGFGSRGGLAIQESASLYKIQNTKYKIQLPRPLLHDDTLNFSFSGLKTAIMRTWHACHPELVSGSKSEKVLQSEFAYEVQEAITDVLVAKTIKAAELHNASSILIGGGVAANLRLRKKFQKLPFNFHCPPVALCTDNAAYIGSYAFFRGTPVNWHTIEAVPDLSVEV